MIIPVRCFTCGYPIATKWEEYSRRVARGEDPKKVLDDLGIKDTVVDVCFYLM